MNQSNKSVVFRSIGLDFELTTPRIVEFAHAHVGRTSISGFEKSMHFAPYLLRWRRIAKIGK